MENLLSIVTFIPLLAAAILALFLRGDDEGARKHAKWVAMLATGAFGAMQWLLAIPLVAAIARSVMGEAPETGDRFGLAQYVVLFFALSALASVAVPGAATLPGVSP